MDHYGIRVVVNLPLKSYLDHRIHYVSNHNSKSPEQIVEYGISQCSIPGPLFFLIYANDIPSCLETIPSFFADDTALLITGKTSTKEQVMANSELEWVSQ